MKKLLFLFALFLVNNVFSQDININIGNNNIAVNEPFTITISVNNDRLRNYSNFPEIYGFSKRGTSSSASTNIINGKMSFSESITQNYAPSKEGKFVVKPFTITINGRIARSNGTTINVGAPKQARRNSSPFDYDPFEDFFGPKSEKEFVDVKEDAFFALTTNKSEVYVGEGVTATLAFYVAVENRAEMQFYDLGTQLVDILKKIRLGNCWEENFGIEEIQKEPIVINNKNYTQYKLYQAVFYPLNTESLVFPPVNLKMIKYKVAKNPSFFGENRMEDFKNFQTEKRVVKVRDLPPHPLKDKVSVGIFKLDEKISKHNLSTGESFNYNFKINGEGNISSINGPEIPEDNNFDIYKPNVRQSITRSAGRVTGSKSFSYYGIPKEPGEYELKNYFYWIYFNLQTQQYDTLRSSLAVNVSGESKINHSISSNDLGDFYNQIEISDNKLESRDRNEWIKMTANIFILVMLGFTAYFVLKK